MKNISKIQNIYDNDNFFQAYKALRENNQGFNALLEQPAICSLLPELHNKAVLEIGCGCGDFVNYLIKNDAASVLAIDPSANMLRAARKNSDDSRITFQQIAVENLECNAASFDLIVSSLVFHYVENFDFLVKKMASWLKPQGQLIFSVEHPICTAYPAGKIQTDAEGQLFHPVYNYRDEKLFEQDWLVSGVQKYHRTLSTYINNLLAYGLNIKQVLEPMPDDELIASREG